MTNEKWLESLTTEEKAEAFSKLVWNIISFNNDPKPSEVKTIFNNWLREKHEE